MTTLLPEKLNEINTDYRIGKLNQVIRGRINYFRMGSMITALAKIDGQLRTRMRIVVWKQWKKASKKIPGAP